MDVELTVEESSALQKALRSYTSELRMEIADTDNAEFRRGLRHEREVLEGVIAKLDDAASTSAHLDEEGRVVVRIVSVWLR